MPTLSSIANATQAVPVLIVERADRDAEGRRLLEKMARDFAVPAVHLRRDTGKSYGAAKVQQELFRRGLQKR